MALENLIHQETDEPRQFISLIEEGLDALAAGRADNARDCMNRKRTLLDRIFAAPDAVNAVASRASSNPHQTMAEPWLAHASSERIRHAFHCLIDHAHEARERHQLANRLIRIKLPGTYQGQEVFAADQDSYLLFSATQRLLTSPSAWTSAVSQPAYATGRFAIR